MAAGLALACDAASAKPLDANGCTQLKSERDALEAAGVRTAMVAQPPPRMTRPLDERAQKISALIRIDGQLRFRCNMELPIPTLKPELLVEVPDVIDGEAPAPAIAKKAPARRAAKRADKSPGGGEAQPVAPKADANVAPKPKPKPQSKLNTKAGDAYRPPSATPSAEDATKVPQ